jgi:hypothetical protein
MELRAYPFKVTLAELQLRDADKSTKYRGQSSGELVGRGIPVSVHVIQRVRWWKVKFMATLSDDDGSDKSKLPCYWVPLMIPTKGLQMVQLGHIKRVSIQLDLQFMHT